MIKINKFLFFFDEFRLILPHFNSDGEVYFLTRLKYLVGILFQPVELLTIHEEVNLLVSSKFVRIREKIR